MSEKLELKYLEKFPGEKDFNSLLELKKQRLAKLLTHKKFREILEKISLVKHSPLKNEYEGDIVKIAKDFPHPEQIEELAKELIPWRKGPFQLGDLHIDSEWKCEDKWKRFESALENLDGKYVLDIGCNNGYFMFKLLQKGAKEVLGIDPTIPFYTQFQFLNALAREPSLHFEMFGVEHLKYFKKAFDVILYMGIIYHHKDPISQLIDVKESLAPGGYAILETIGIPGEESYALFPEGKYAAMRNVWFVPTLSCFYNWAKKAKFKKVEILDSSILTSNEQRVTNWSSEVSLDNFLDTNDKSKTIEGHPAPMRFCLKAYK